jgi:REP element-mobilizing transposase RayT
MIVEKWLGEIENKYKNATVMAHVVMPDHIHFILHNPGYYDDAGAHIGAPLPEIVKWFKTQTTNEYIRGVKAGLFVPFDQHVWQRNYFEHVIRDQEDFETRRKYIYENPLRWQFKHG